MTQRDYASLVAKVWNYAHVLRDQGISYGDYVEQITYLLFLKMDEERADLLGEESIIPTPYRWGALATQDGDALEAQYRHTLESLGREPGLIGTIFKKAQNKLTDPAKLKRVVSLIGNEGPWIGMNVDVKGEIYEGLLEKNATEVKSGAGQYFTPRPVIEAIVQCVRPRIGETVCDPACGTGGFLLAAYEQMKDQSHDRDLLHKLRNEALTGVDIVAEVVRLCAMNLYLHGIGNGGSPVQQADDRGARQETERFRRFSYEELTARDKLNLDIFWLKDDSLEDIDSLPAPDLIAAEIVENLEAALEQFRSVAAELGDEE